MSIPSPARDDGPVDMEDDDHLDLSPDGEHPSSDEETVKGEREQDHIAEILEEERQQQDVESTPPTINPLSHNRYRQLLRDRDDASETGSSEGLPRRVGSPIGSLQSIPDDTPSIQGSMLSSVGSGVLPSLAMRPGFSSPTPSFRPFDQRFQSRTYSPSNLSPRPSSPAFLTGHNRNVSLSSQFFSDSGEAETSSPPWEVVRWTKLKKLNGQAFSEAGKRNFGSPTCIAIAASIVLGTSKGIILMFDYSQNLKMIIGPGTKAVESGPITAIAISADHSTIAGGHEDGSIFTWDTSRASRPFLYIPHLDPSQLQTRTMDGHLPKVPVTHLGFLGTRHTALVSADARGMAFSHLATRGTGALGRTVKTVRILGRYPDTPAPVGKPLKPSTVLAFSPLPLGNVERATDGMGLTAMLTPYLLVIVSTTPVAQTQHKSARPKDVAPHSAMSGCLAWFPAVKLKVPDPNTGSTTSKAKLVYCWSNVLTVLDVDEIPSEDDKPPSLKFKARSRWNCEEAIVAVQWLSRSVLTVLTITQRLIVLEDRSMRMTEAFDLIHKYIYHVDLFSEQLHALVEQLDEEDTSMHGVVADAFYMSFKAYKGRIFLLGFNDVSIGALSNWADRLIALMENGDYIAAIQLATSYYTGDADKLTVGLPEDAALRHQMVHDKLMEIMAASLKYAFSQRQRNTAAADDQHLHELAETCFIACQSVKDMDFLFDEMYEWYEEGDVEGIFLETLEPYILEKTISSVPPTAVKAMVTHYVAKGWESRLEEIICHMDTSTLDIDQVTLLCKQHGLYDALIYVWNQALHDYITPLIDLLTLLIPLTQAGDSAFSGGSVHDEILGVNALKMFPYLSYTLTGRVYPTGEFMDDTLASQAKAEIYWFLFSGQSITWPKGSSGKMFLTRPGQSQEPSFPYLRMILKFDAPSFLSALNEAFEDSFLNDSQEKHLNGGTRRDLPEEQIFGLTVDRQYVVSILLEIMNPTDFAPEDTIYLDMFIARNLPKFPQYLLVPGSTLNRVITGLCNYPGPDLAEDAQLSTEYLLSIYQPPDLSPMIPLFKKAGFYRILKRIYKNERQYGKLIQTYFEDAENQEEIFDCIADCLRAKAGLTKRQIQDIHDVLKQNSDYLAELDPVRAARTLDTHAPELHRFVLDSLVEEPELQYTYLKALLEPESDTSRDQPSKLDRDFIEQYVQLMCRYNPSHVSDYVEIIQATNLRLDKLLPTMEDTGVIDAAVILMAREGQVQDAMERLTRHLNTLESALQGLVSGADTNNEELDIEGAAEELLKGLQKYTHVGIWLCQGQMKTSRKLNSVQRRQNSLTSDELTLDENLWLDLIDTTVQITRRLSSVVAPAENREIHQEDNDNKSTSSLSSNLEQQQQTLDSEKLVALLRSLVQHTFTALLNATSSQGGTGSLIDKNRAIPIPTDSETNTGGGVGVGGARPDSATFLRILRAFLTRAAASSPSLADLRAVLTSVFAAYAYEESILGLANRLLEQQLFADVRRAALLRQRGWRPRGSTCEGCGRRVWGPGVAVGGGGGNDIFEAWEERRVAEEGRRRDDRNRRRREVLARMGGGGGNGEDGGMDGAGDGDGDEGVGKGKGKGKEKGRSTDVGVSHVHTGDEPSHRMNANGKEDLVRRENQPLGPLIVFACRHIYHKNCLDALQSQQQQWDGGPSSSSSSSSPASAAGGDYGRSREVNEFGREVQAYRCPIDG